MKNDKEKIAKTKTGRTSKYTPETINKIYEALRSGCTDLDAAHAVGISKDTFYEWIKTKTDFADIVKNAKKEFQDWEYNGILSDAKKSLRTLICGMEYEETKIELGRGHTGGELKIVRKTTTTKKVLPNATAVIFALCNRDPEHWQNRVASDVNAKIDAENKSDVSLVNVPDDLLAQVLECIKGK